jgi:transposase InsO family protein
MVEQAILRARAELQEGPHVIGWALGLAASTVHAVLRRHGRSRLVVRAPREEIVRYERAAPGELVHVDIKKLSRIVRPGHRVTDDRSRRAQGAGWLYLYVAIDDHSRLGFAAVHSDETADSALRFLDELVRFYRSHGITVERVLTDNGTCFKRRWADACDAYEIVVKKTRAYRPQTNGKAARFIRTLLERWAYAYSYDHESERLAALAPALDFTIASVHTARLEASRRYSASTTSLGHTASPAHNWWWRSGLSFRARLIRLKRQPSPSKEERIMTAINSIHLEVPDLTVVEAFYRDAFGLVDPVHLRASEAPSAGFRGFTLSLVVSQPASVGAFVRAAPMKALPNAVRTGLTRRERRS